MVSTDKALLAQYDTRVVVGGCSTFTDYRHFISILDEHVKTLPPNPLFVSGDSKRGMDAMLVSWCELRRYPLLQFGVDWLKNGRIAGFLRNMDMCHECNYSLAIYDGRSNGVRNLLHWSRRLKLNTTVVLYDPATQPSEEGMPHLVKRATKGETPKPKQPFQFNTAP